MVDDIGKFKIIYLKEKLRRLKNFNISKEYSKFKTEGDGIDCLIYLIEDSINTNDFTEINNDNFYELSCPLTNILIIESFSNKWVMKRRKGLIDILLNENDIEDVI